MIGAFVVGGGVLEVQERKQNNLECGEVEV